MRRAAVHTRMTGRHNFTHAAAHDSSLYCAWLRDGGSGSARPRASDGSHRFSHDT
jgi:hypothetical protein